MALSKVMMFQVCDKIKPGDRIASFGYPDIIGDHKMILGNNEPKYRHDSAQICNRHGLDHRQIADADSFFGILGAKLDVFDIIKERGCEILIDLNEKITGYGNYDLVLDVGTMEHCFNVGQAAKNMAGMVKVGGIIAHENPFNWGNHGFYGFNPTWYADFYEQNGFKILKCFFVLKDGTMQEVDMTKRFKFTKIEANVFAMAEKIKEVSFGWPTQTKYKKLLG